MNRSDKTILVLGATGHQGGAAAKHLLADGWHVRALAHHPDSPAARELETAGMELAPGDLLDRESLDRAVAGCYGVYSVQTPAGAPEGSEELEGNNIADAAKAAGVEHFVFSSVEGAQLPGGPQYVEPKRRIEAHIAEIGLPATIWRPVTFMENYLRHKDEILGGRFVTPRWPDSMVCDIAVDDIGRFVALAFSDPARFIGTSMEIAGDCMTAAKLAETFSEVLGVDVKLEHDDSFGMAIPRPVPGEVQKPRADVDACRELIPDLMRFREWVVATGWAALVSR